MIRAGSFSLILYTDVVQVAECKGVNYSDPYTLLSTYISGWWTWGRKGERNAADGDLLTTSHSRLFVWEYITPFYLIKVFSNRICDYYMSWMHKAYLPPNQCCDTESNFPAWVSTSYQVFQSLSTRACNLQLTGLVYLDRALVHLRIPVIDGAWLEEIDTTLNVFVVGEQNSLFPKKERSCVICLW